MPSTLVRSPRRGGPITFATITAAILEAAERRPEVRERPRCCALEDDGRRCGMPARYLDFNRGGHVCFEHRPDRKQEALAL